MLNASRVFPFILGGLLLVLGYQNCAPTFQADSGESNLSLQYSEMTPAAAQSMVDSYSTSCASSGAATQMGAAPASISAGTSMSPTNSAYTLSGGTTSISEAYGNVFIVGSGTVILDGSVTGNLIVCGPTVSFARGGGGNLYIENASLGNVQSYTGNIVIKNGGPTGSISAMFGNLAWINGSVAKGRTYSGL